LANGSAVLAYRSDTADDSNSGTTEHVSVATSLDETTGTGGGLLSALVWGDPRSLAQGPAVFNESVDPTGSEDPFLWDDQNGNLHLLMHEIGHTGLHAFSADGAKWTVSPTRPYTGNVTFDDGTWQVMAHRERAQLVLDPATRRPLALSTAVRPSSDDDYTYTLVSAVR